MWSPKELSLTYSDIGLRPTELSTIRSRNDVDTSTQFLDFDLELPILAAPMETVVSRDNLSEFFDKGVLPVLPRRAYNIESDLEGIKTAIYHSPYILAVPANKDLEKYLEAMTGAHHYRSVCIDVANGHHIAVEEAVRTIKEYNPNLKIIAGNIASLNAYRWMSDIGVHAVRVGIGGGSVCSTSVATGVGAGQATLVRELAEERRFLRLNNIYSRPLIIADGGIKSAGDIAKAIALGADVVMCGGLFAGTYETPGAKIKINGRDYKELAGQASMQVKRSSAYVEGVKTLVPYKGQLEDVVDSLRDGLRSSMAYMNAKTIEDFKYLPERNFVRLTNGAKEERQPASFT